MVLDIQYEDNIDPNNCMISLSNHEEEASNNMPFGGNNTPVENKKVNLERKRPQIIPPSSNVRSPLSPSPKLSSLSPGLFRTFQPKMISKTLKTINMSDSENNFKDPKSLLIKYRTESLLLSEIHNKSSEYCFTRNQICMILSLTITLICSIIDIVLQKYKNTQNFFTTISFIFIGTINVIFNFLAYQQKAELHKQVRDSYCQIVEMIEVTFAYTNSREVICYDINRVLGEIRQIHNNLTKITPPIPRHISKKYESILCPSLIKRELKESKNIEN